MTGEKVHWVGEYNNTLHGNGAGSKDMERTSGDEDEVTCRLCLSLLARVDVRERITPTPAPSEVAETTAGEREAACPWCHYGDPHPTFSDCPAVPDAGGVEALAKVLAGRLPYGWASPLRGLANQRAVAEQILASDWLAALLDRVRREEGAKVLREAAEATEQFAEEVYGEHFFRRPTKQDYAEINALLKRERGHQLDGIGADCYHHALTVRAEMLREMAAEIEEAASDTRAASVGRGEGL